MKVLFLGGTGTISRAVVKESLNRGCHVTIMNRGNHNELVPSEVRTLIADFYNKTQVATLFQNDSYDVVVDFLSRRKEDIFRIYPILKTKCKQYIFISTACVYDRESFIAPFSEISSKPDRRWNYSLEKYECEQALISLSTIQCCSFYTIVRPYITYDKERIPIGLSPMSYKNHRTIIERVKSGKPMFVIDKGNTKTTITSSRDFARAFVRLFLNENALNEDFNLTSSFVYTNKEILQIISDCLGVKMNIVEVDESDFLKIFPQYKEMYVADRKYDEVFDNSKLIKAIGNDFQFEDKFENVFKEIVNYYTSLSTYDYDYCYDALCDKLIQCKYSTKLRYVSYPYSLNNSQREYLLYKYLPFKYATAIRKLLL